MAISVWDLAAQTQGQLRERQVSTQKNAMLLDNIFKRERARQQNAQFYAGMAEREKEREQRLSIMEKQEEVRKEEAGVRREFAVTEAEKARGFQKELFGIKAERAEGIRAEDIARRGKFRAEDIALKKEFREEDIERKAAFIEKGIKREDVVREENRINKLLLNQGVPTTRRNIEIIKSNDPVAIDKLLGIQIEDQQIGDGSLPGQEARVSNLKKLIRGASKKKREEAMQDFKFESAILEERKQEISREVNAENKENPRLQLRIALGRGLKKDDVYVSALQDKLNTGDTQAKKVIQNVFANPDFIKNIKESANIDFTIEGRLEKFSENYIKELVQRFKQAGGGNLARWQLLGTQKNIFDFDKFVEQKADALAKTVWEESGQSGRGELPFLRFVFTPFDKKEKLAQMKANFESSIRSALLLETQAFVGQQ